MIKILTMILMITLSTEAMADDRCTDKYPAIVSKDADEDSDAYRLYKNIYHHHIPCDPILRKIYLDNITIDQACGIYLHLKRQLVEQSKDDSDAMWFYWNTENYVNKYVNPRIKDMEDLKNRFVGLEAYIKTHEHRILSCQPPLK